MGLSGRSLNGAEGPSGKYRSNDDADQGERKLGDFWTLGDKNGSTGHLKQSEEKNHLNSGCDSSSPIKFPVTQNASAKGKRQR